MATTDGEICEACQPVLVAMQDQIDGLHATIHKQAQVIGQMKRTDPDKKAREHELWDTVGDLFTYWKRKTGHSRSRYTVARFNMARPFVEQHGIELCVRAIDGISYDPFCARRRNGTLKRFDGWEQVFETDAKFEEACNKAPFRPTYTLEDDAEEVKEHT